MFRTVATKGNQVRIGVIGRIAHDNLATNVVDALQGMGHSVTQLGSTHSRHQHQIFNWIEMTARRALPSFDEQAQQRVVRAAVDASCEIVLNLEAALLMPGIVSQLSRRDIRTAFWFPDCVANMGRHLMLLAPYDALFFKEPHVVEHLRANLGLPVYYLPEACNPRWHRPVTVARTDPHLVLAGNMYPSRVKLLERLIAKGIPLALYGSDFPRWLGDTSARAAHAGRSIYREEKARVFRSSVGVLNTLHPAEIVGVNARLFEATACGAAVITEFRPAVPELFSVGDEVLAFHDFDDLVDQATRLLNEAALTASLGDAATLRAHRDHTYQSRLSVILEKLS